MGSSVLAGIIHTLLVTKQHRCVFLNPTEESTVKHDLETVPGEEKTN